jgi:hypothetical protein
MVLARGEGQITPSLGDGLLVDCGSRPAHVEDAQRVNWARAARHPGATLEVSDARTGEAVGRVPGGPYEPGER